jgi:formylglycine-generating enzyme required for sulfatase activity
MRGGSWYYFSKNSRSAWLWKNDARVKSYGIGFRVVRELD